MAENTSSATQEPSMEEILASIRKIISEDKPEDQAASADGSDILELTQMVQDDGTVVNLEDPLKVEAPVPPPVVAAPPPPPPPAPVPVMEFTPAPAPDASGLASEQAISTAASALAALANTTKIERMATAPAAGMPLGNGMRTLEDMVLETMRPMIKDWLDKNLPEMVERLVQKEVERITKRVD